MAKSKSEKSSEPNTAHKRTYLKQSDVPMASLDDGLRVVEAIFDHYAGKPTSPFQLAKALNLDPKGSQLKVLTGAAIAFGADNKTHPSLQTAHHRLVRLG
jgi:hypothetical protein